MARKSVSFEARQQVWLEDEAERLGLTFSEMVRRCVSESIELAKKAEPENETKDRRHYKTRLLDVLGKHYHLSQAAKACDVPVEAAFDLLENDPEFAEKWADGQEAYLQEVEEHLVKIGMGRAIGNVTALIAILNAYIPEWGRIKVELLNRIFNPIFDALLKVVEDKVSPSVYREVAKEFADVKELKFSQFSE